MDEQRTATPVEAPSDGAGIPTEPKPASTAQSRSRRGTIGVAAALVVAFVWGGLAYRELGPKTTRSLAGAAPVVAGAQAPPGWVGDFADAFCAGDAGSIAPRIGPPLTGNVAAITEALNDRDWTCSHIAFLGGGTNPKGTFYVFVMRDDTQNEQWWVFTVLDEKVVAIE